MKKSFHRSLREEDFSDYRSKNDRISSEETLKTLYELYIHHDYTQLTDTPIPSRMKLIQKHETMDSANGDEKV